MNCSVWVCYTDGFIFFFFLLSTAVAFGLFVCITRSYSLSLSLSLTHTNALIHCFKGIETPLLTLFKLFLSMKISEFFVLHY